MSFLANFFQKIWVTLKSVLIMPVRRFALKKKKNEELLKLPAPFVPDEDAGSKQYEAHPSSAYMMLKMIFRDIGRYNAVIETLGRDFLTAMPKGAYKSRLGQIGFLHRRKHEELASPQVAALIEEAHVHEKSNPDSWDSWDHANLREMEIMYRHHCQVDPELIERRARLGYEGRRVHSDVMKNNDWDTARPFLEDMISLTRRIAESKCLRDNEHESESPYQALMREYIPGFRITDIESLFKKTKTRLDILLPQIFEKQEQESAPLPLKGPFPETQQMWLNKTLLRAIGFDFSRGGLYETGFNPVEGGTPEDTHLVIKAVNQNNFLISMKSTLHEGGHGLYVQGLPRDIWRYQPIGYDMGNAWHESQALMIEMILGRRREFFDYLAPRVEGLFQKFGDPSMAADNLYKLKTRVKKTADRKTADEVTYFYHINLRFELERKLFSGELEVKDLPDAWSAGIEEALGVKPENNAEGCLQDVHWFVGKFGYFPSYALGHMIAAQLYTVMRKDIQNIPELLSEGNLIPVRDWLNDKVHKQGRLLRPGALIEDITGNELGPGPLLTHLEERYLHNA